MVFFSEELVLKDSQDTIGSWEDDILCVLVDLLTNQTFNRKQMLFQVLSIFAKIMGLWVFNATYHISDILWWKVLLEKTN